VEGYVHEGSGYSAVTPARLADTRPNPVPSGTTLEVQVAGRGGIPTDAQAAMINLTIVEPTGAGYATAFACGTTPPTSSINYTAGTNYAIANELMVDLSPTGGICIYVSTTANVIIDTVGYA
ncbi:MAG: hypothetical protein MUE78_11220, partial [Ilumatobacteraceae bacterium]|nr:hypothetical protein [Ilumatobacteraceae bacterium]